MDLGIAGKWALVCGASKGLGFGCAKALAQEGVNLVINARNPEALQEAAASLAALAPQVKVLAVAADITTEEGRAAVLSAAGGRAWISISSSPMRAARLPAISVTGTARPGSRPWTPTCSRPSS